MENIRQKKKPCEEKKIFAPKMASENAFKQGRKRLLDTPKRMIKRREREGKRAL